MPFATKSFLHLETKFRFYKWDDHAGAAPLSVNRSQEIGLFRLIMACPSILVMIRNSSVRCLRWSSSCGGHAFGWLPQGMRSRVGPRLAFCFPLRCFLLLHLQAFLKLHWTLSKIFGVELCIFWTSGASASSRQNSGSRTEYCPGLIYFLLYFLNVGVFSNVSLFFNEIFSIIYEHFV